MSEKKTARKEYNIEIELKGRIKAKRTGRDTLSVSLSVLDDIMEALSNIKGWMGHDFSEVEER